MLFSWHTTLTDCVKYIFSERYMVFRCTKQEELLYFIGLIQFSSQNHLSISWFPSLFPKEWLKDRPLNSAWEAIKKEVVQGHIAEIVERFWRLITQPHWEPGKTSKMESFAKNIWRLKGVYCFPGIIHLRCLTGTLAPLCRS